MSEVHAPRADYRLILHIRGTQWPLHPGLTFGRRAAPSPEELQAVLAPHLVGDVRVAWPTDIDRQEGQDRQYLLHVPDANEIEAIVQAIVEFMTNRETGIPHGTLIDVILRDIHGVKLEQGLAKPRS